MAKENVYDRTRRLRDKSGRAASEAEGESASYGRRHPSSTERRTSVRSKPKPTSMAPRKGGKRKHYGRAFNEGKKK